MSVTFRRSSSQKSMESSGSKHREDKASYKKSSSSQLPGLNDEHMKTLFSEGFRQIDMSSTVNIYPSNRVQTSRYSLFSWAPKSLLWQFRRTANIYFLIISVMTAMPFSPKSPWSMASTFAVILTFTMLKEAYEDYFRHKQDREINNSKTMKFENQEYKEITWESVKVGDILYIQEDDFIPADLVCLKSSDETGLSFVNTMNLDGETNLKEKIALESTQKLQNFKDVIVTAEEPSSNLHSFKSSLKNTAGRWEPVGLSQLILRGSQLKNTDYILGVTVYTGKETKIMLNSKAAPSKVSLVLKKMNKILYLVFLMQAMICVTFSAFYVSWDVESHIYLEKSDKANFFVQILTYWVAYSHLVPISLYVTLEIVKLGIAYLVSHDISIYNEEDDRPAQSRTSDLIEELGQVQFIFSDKTGTITCNSMVLKKCSVRGIRFEGDPCLSRSFEIQELVKSNTDIQNFFRALALCHNVFPVLKEDKIEYHATSPDEHALVSGAASLGFKLIGKSQRKLSLSIRDEAQNWEVLEEIPFTSDRKCMSVIVRHNSQITLYCKGADQVMLPMLEPGTFDLKKLMDTLSVFSSEGLRTLIVASRPLDFKYYSDWVLKWRELGLSKVPQYELDRHARLLEEGLGLLGVTAVEDKLQEGVGETIQFIMNANIKFWMLTGDKTETAIEIAKSCNIILGDMRVLNISATSSISFVELLEHYVGEFELLETPKTEREEFCLVVDGPTLAFLFEENEETQSYFFKLGCLAKSCLCCRVSPQQKAQVVQLAKKFGNYVSLAIGDGANDVSMIQEANIGIGVAGKEGTQAIQASDYAIGKFRYLKNLLFVHGRWGYRRVSLFIYYYFYKNMAIVFTELWFSFFNGFSGQIFFLDWLPMLYNSLWTSWPCIFTCIFDQDVSAEKSLNKPELYKCGQIGSLFSFRGFCKWILFAMWHGGLCFWLTASFGEEAKPNGQGTGLWWLSTLAFTLVIHVVTLKMYLESRYWNIVNISIGILSVIFYYSSVLVLSTKAVSSVFQDEIYNLFYNILGNGAAWILIIFVPFFVLIPDFLLKSWERLEKPRRKSKIFPEKNAKLSKTFY